MHQLKQLTNNNPLNEAATRQFGTTTMQLVKLYISAIQLIGALHTSNADCTYIEAWDDELRDQLIAELEAVDNNAMAWTAEDGAFADLCAKLDLDETRATTIYTFGGNTICLAEDWQ